MYVLCDWDDPRFGTDWRDYLQTSEEATAGPKVGTLGFVPPKSQKGKDQIKQKSSKEALWFNLSI